jgi:hypothetical protein
MIKFERTEVMNFENAIRGMRNPMNSWDKSDSRYNWSEFNAYPYYIGPKDLALAQKLINAGSDHRKFLRQIFVSVDITAPLYWWKEYDTYKVGTVANSCSTMHKIHSRPIEMSDFSFDFEEADDILRDAFCSIVDDCEFIRKKFVKTNDKKYWRALIQLLPESYNQMRTCTMTYENLINIYNARRHHKLTEWHTMCDWIEKLPYFKELCLGGGTNE